MVILSWENFRPQPRKTFYYLNNCSIFSLQHILYPMIKTRNFFLLFSILLLHCQYGDAGPCPRQFQIGSVVSARITIAEQRGLIPLIKGQDVQCYNYTLPYTFSKVPQVAISTHDFEAYNTDDLFYAIKPIKSQSQTHLPLLTRTYWKYTTWRKISFSIFVEDRTDLQSGYHQVDTGLLGGCEPGKSITVILPFKEINGQGNITHLIFLHGFEISSQRFTQNQKSPFEIQVVETHTNFSCIVALLSVTTITQVHSVYISYIAWQTTNLNVVYGSFTSDIENKAQISHIPEKNVGRNYARIFGITGFIINRQEQDIYYSTHWTGSKFVFELDSSTPFTKYISFQYLFLLGSECSDCPGFPLNHDGRCKQVCPIGTYATSENVCIDCGVGHFWDGHSCVKQCPQGQFLNTKNNQCECPAGLHWNNARCISCPGGKVFNKEKNLCVCPPNTRWNGYGCSTIQVCQNGKKWNVFKFMCQCPSNTRWNGTFCAPLLKCKNGQISQGNECVCPPFTFWNGQWCQQTDCKEGQIWNGTGCACEPGHNWNGSMCLLCINGQQWNSQSNRCVCPQSYVWNGNFCKKVYTCTGNRIFNETVQQCLCRQNQFWNGFSCMVQPQCCCGQVFNLKTFQCDCPDNFNWDGKNCLLCLNGKIWSQSNKTCYCREGTQWNGHFCVVIQECHGGTMWNQNTWSCECPSTMVWNGQYCTANPCMGGQFWDNLIRKCKCPDGFNFVQGKCVRPEDLCKNNKIWDQTLMRCVCPMGYWQYQEKCLKIPDCQGDQQFNPLNGKCQCPLGLVYLQSKKDCGDPTCPQDQRWDGFGCVNISCPPNSYYNGTQCVCPDPRDKCKPWQFFDGISCVYQPGSCPEGTQWNGTYCAPDSNCPIGYYHMGNDCKPLPQRCIPPTYYHHGRCLVSKSCPQGTYFRSGTCLPYVPCQNGQKWDNDRINCVCPQGTQWNGERCLSCSGGKTWSPFEGCVCPTGSFFSGSRCEKATQDRCSLIPNSLWDGTQCVCHDGFTVVGMQCVCDGVVVGNRCDRCAHRPNSQWKYGECRCKQGYTLYGSECLGNQIGNNSPSDCNVGTFYDHQQRRCLPCPAGCLSCSSSYVCDQCRQEFNYDASSQLCIEVCGDGKRFVLDCDDGDNDDGDGCSMDCKVEPGYICRGGSPNTDDSCVIYLPPALTIIQTGQIRYSSKIIVNIKLDYLPKKLIQSEDCNDLCSNVLDGKLTAGDTQTLSITSKFLPGTTFSFSVEIEFGRPYIGSFTLEITVNPTIANKYFINVAPSTLTVDVNPALLSTLDKDDQLL